MARFPAEAIAALRAQGLMGVMAPRDVGGEAMSIPDIADIRWRLGRACSSTAMIYAMHQTKVACIVRHSAASAWHQSLLRRLCDEQMLLASSTTEGQGGGKSLEPGGRRARGCTLFPASRRRGHFLWRSGRRHRHHREASGRCGQLRSGARRIDKGRLSLEPTRAWDTMGMRGTCSAGFDLKARRGGSDLARSLEIIHAQTMTPVAHLLWSSVWTGIATDAVERARAFLAWRRATRMANCLLALRVSPRRRRRSPPCAAYSTAPFPASKASRGIPMRFPQSTFRPRSICSRSKRLNWRSQRF